MKTSLKSYITDAKDILTKMTHLRLEIINHLKELEKIDPDSSIFNRDSYEKKPLELNTLEEAEKYNIQKQLLEKMFLATMELKYLAGKTHLVIGDAEKELASHKVNDAKNIQEVTTLKNRLTQYESSHVVNTAQYEKSLNLPSILYKNINLPDFISEIAFHESRLSSELPVANDKVTSELDQANLQYQTLVNNLDKTTDIISKNFKILGAINLKKLVHTLEHVHIATADARKYAFTEAKNLIAAKNELLRMKKELLSQHYNLGKTLIVITGKSTLSRTGHDSTLVFIDQQIADIDLALESIDTSKLEVLIEKIDHHQERKKSHSFSRMYDYAKENPGKVVLGALAGATCFKFLPVLGAVKGALLVKSVFAAKLGTGAATGATATSFGSEAKSRLKSFFFKSHPKEKTQNDSLKKETPLQSFKP